MFKHYKKESGAIAIEAIIGLSFFMVCVIGIMCMSLVARVQANLQYALDQTAKEISGYYYLLDKFGLASITAGTVPSEMEETVGKLDGAIGGVVSFASTTAETGTQISNDGIFEPSTYVNLVQSGSAEELASSFQNLTQSFSELEGTSITDSAKAVIATFAKASLNKAITKYIASPVCRAMICRYLGVESQQQANEVLSSLGVRQNAVGSSESIEGLASIDFSHSYFLEDGRSIKLVAIYTIDAKALTLGAIDAQWQFRQVASTAAWIVPDDGSKRKLEDIVVGD